jgi:ribosomal protein S15P/S13E
MTFTTTGDAIELRRRAHAMAEHMNAHSSDSSGAMGMHGGMMGADASTGMGGGSMMGRMMPAMHAQVEDVDHGARLKMTPADPKKLGEVREHMKQHAQSMNQTHGCSMTADAGR